VRFNLGIRKGDRLPFKRVGSLAAWEPSVRPKRVDLIIIGAFTEAAHTAYALSNLFRSKGAITVIGGPHARCYPEHALRYFDYVLGFTDRETLRDVLRDCSPHRPVGMHMAARQQPKTLPGVRQRWPFIEVTLKKAPMIKIVPMLGSLGCPHTCSFCIDAGKIAGRAATDLLIVHRQLAALVGLSRIR
jgi:radical SAM superfamily enzyme YgiQ (UPF0313 family)